MMKIVFHMSLGRILRPLLKTGFPLIGNVLKPLVKCVLIPIALTATASTTDAATYKKNVWIWHHNINKLK